MPFSEEDKAFLAESQIGVARNLYGAILAEMNNRFTPLFDQISDLRSIAIEARAPANHLALLTEHPVAYESNDHKAPWGTKNDNTRSARFCRALEAHFRRPISAMDLGCSGGGLVFDFLVRGHLAIGLEGSDYSLKSQRAEWRVIDDYLYTCDITKPFDVVDKTTRATHAFDVITMWEVLEHIHEEHLPQLFANVKKHLVPDGLFVGSAALYDDVVNGVSYHPTVKPEMWWRETAQRNGLEFVPKTMFDFADFCRGTGNGPLDPNFAQDPGKGFHFVMRHRAA